MTEDEKCSGGARKANGNCTLPSADDKIAVQCVGDWATEKHDYLRRYVEATHGPRSRYLKPAAVRPAGGAGFIDLFSGPGRARIRTTGQVVDGSPLIALRHTKAAFTKVVLCDMDAENIAALKQRTASDAARTDIVQGDCNTRIDDLVKLLPPHGLNMAFVDPFALSALSFATLRALAKAERMDLILHFPTADIKRNHQNNEDALERFLGTGSWKGKFNGPEDIGVLIDTLRAQLAGLGYTGENVRAVAVKNQKKNILYHLVFASKSKLGDKIWKTIIDTNANGQRELF